MWFRLCWALMASFIYLLIVFVSLQVLVLSPRPVPQSCLCPLRAAKCAPFDCEHVGSMLVRNYGNCCTFLAPSAASHWADTQRDALYVLLGANRRRMGVISFPWSPPVWKTKIDPSTRSSESADRLTQLVLSPKMVACSAAVWCIPPPASLVSGGRLPQWGNLWLLQHKWPMVSEGKHLSPTLIDTRNKMFSLPQTCSFLLQ